MALQQPTVVNILSKQTIKHDQSSSERINLTPCDLEVLELEYNQHGLLFLKPATQHTDSLIHHLRESLQRTLNFFPPLAGRISTAPADDHGDDAEATCFFIDSNNAGVDFIHASLVDRQITVAHFTDSTKDVPDQVFESLFPMAGVRNYEGITQPLISAQVTELSDGLFIGVARNHVVADGASFWHFLNCWAKMSCNLESLLELPILVNRDRLNIDFTGSRSIKIDNKYLAFGHKIAIPDPRPLKEGVFHFTSHSVAKLKERANREMENSQGKISSLQAIIAHFWLSILRVRKVSGAAPLQETTLETPMDARQRIDPPLTKEYLGNAVFPGVVMLEASKILENASSWTAWQINRMVASSTGSDKVKDFLTGWKKNPVFLKLDSLPKNHFVLMSSPRFDAYAGNDFGWGMPVAVRIGKANQFNGRITVSGGVEKGSMQVEACLSPQTLCALQKDEEFMNFVNLKI